MLLSYFTNFCITFTLIVFTFWPFTKLMQKESVFNKFKPMFVGIIYGFTGLILGAVSLKFTDVIMINSRILPLLLSGLIGGPWAVIVSGFCMGLGRFLFPPIIPIAIASSINLILVSIIIAFISRKKPMTFETLPIYFYFIAVEIIAIPFLFDDNKLKITSDILAFFAFSFLELFSILEIMRRLQYASEKVQLTYQLAKKDYLTQLPNNLAITAIANNIVQETEAFSVLHFDVDDMRVINIKYGHLAGDGVIKQLATLIHGYVEPINGIAGRVAGEEFYILLRDAPPAVAIYHAEKLRHQIESHPFNINDAQTTLLTVSIGISSSPDNATTFDNLAIIATDVTTEIKTQGGNLVLHANNM